MKKEYMWKYVTSDGKTFDTQLDAKQHAIMRRFVAIDTLAAELAHARNQKELGVTLGQHIKLIVRIAELHADIELE